MLGKHLGTEFQPLTSSKRGDGICRIGATWNISDLLILFCKKAAILWSLIFSLFGVQWVLHSSIKRNLFGWHGAFVGKRREKAWRATPLCLMWTLWKERNERAYNDIERLNQVLKHSFLYTLVNWARVFIEDHILFIIDFIEWPYV